MPPSQLCAAVFDKSYVRMHVRLCVWLHVCICVHLCVCVRAHVCVHLSQIIIHKEEAKLNFTILFTNERSNLQIKCLCVKKVQTVKNKYKKCQILLQQQMVEGKKALSYTFFKKLIKWVKTWSQKLCNNLWWRSQSQFPMSITSCLVLGF